MIVAIDGPAGSGKSTTARRVAAALDYLYLDTGAMYRAMALAFLRAGADFEPGHAGRVLAGTRLDVAHADDGMHVLLNGEDVSARIRTAEVSEAASRVSALPAVREALVAQQRRIGRERRARGEGVVLEGRDIGTVVFPDADVKVFMQADPRERARRRVADYEARGEAASFDAVLDEIEARDRRDAERAHSPLRRADDAVVLDTTERTIDEQVGWVVDLVRERRQGSAV